MIMVVMVIVSTQLVVVATKEPKCDIVSDYLEVSAHMAMNRFCWISLTRMPSEKLLVSDNDPAFAFKLQLWFIDVM